MDKRLLEILCCPATQQPLRLLTRSELERVNQAVAAGLLVHTDGSVWRNHVDAALITRDGSRVYRIEDDIPVMLADMSIASDRIEGLRSSDR